MMSRNTSTAQHMLTTASIETVISRVIQRELLRNRTARLRSDRRRVAAQRARTFDKVALAAVSRS
jgi:hypothetical protein